MASPAVTGCGILVNQYLLSACHVPKSILAPEDTAGNKTGTTPAFLELIFSREIDYKNVNSLLVTDQVQRKKI